MSRNFNSYTLVFATVLVTALCALNPATSFADEAADIARILELNDAYAEASKAWRGKEITRAEMQERHKAIMAESRRINLSYGKPGSAGRRAWDKQVTQAKNAHARSKRLDAQAAKAEQSARKREAREAEKAAAAAAARQRELAELEAEVRLTAELRTRVREDLIDSETGWIGYGDIDQAARERQVALVRKWEGSEHAVQFSWQVWEQFIDQLRERSAMTTAQRRPGTKPANGEHAVTEAAVRDEAAWIATLPRPQEVMGSYPGNDPESAARRAVALGLVARGLSSTPDWNKKSLEGTLLEQEYYFEIFKHNQLFPVESSERTAYDQAKVVLNANQDFVREVAGKFQPHEVERMDFAENWQKTKAQSARFGETASRVLAIALTVIYILWALLSIFRDFRGGGFEASEIDGRLDVVYQRNKHGILALLAAVLVWGFLVVIWALILPNEEPEFITNAVLRDPHNAGWYAFWINFIIFGVPATGLLLLNLLRLGKKNFSITTSGLIIQSKTYIFGPEQSYYVQAPDTGPERQLAQGGGGVYFIGSGPAVAAAMAGQAVGGAMRSGQQAAQGIGRLLAVAIARARFSIRFVHQGGESVLAKGLSRKRANGMLDRIGEYLQAETIES